MLFSFVFTICFLIVIPVYVYFASDVGELDEVKFGRRDLFFQKFNYFKK